jgi:L-fuculose-phosphate aldolase
METIEHFARISLVARMLGREHLLSSQEVRRLQGLRDSYGIASPAEICTTPDPGSSAGDPNCQIIVAPSSPTERLVPDTSVGRPGAHGRVGIDGEIRLTYAQLTTLIEEAVDEMLK